MVRDRVAAQWSKLRMRMYVKRCNGLCGGTGYHTHDLRLYGKWHFIWRYKVQDLIFRDQRPQPPVDELVGASWMPEYEADWKQEFAGFKMQSCYVRDVQGFWVWVTNTPQWDRDWFQKRGWQFPAAWITGPSKSFYQAGSDLLSTLVALPPKSGGSTMDKGETW